MHKRLTTEEFIERANKVHNNKFDYSNVRYVNMKTHVNIVCPKHGDFEVTPSNHLAGKDCPNCAKETRKHYWQNLTDEEKKIHGEKVKNGYQNMSKEDYNKMIENKSKSRLKWLNSLSDEEKAEYYKKILDGQRNPEDGIPFSQKMKRVWANRSEDDKKELFDKVKECWENKSEEELLEHKNKISKTWKSKSEEELEEIISKTRETWSNKSEEEVEEYKLKMKQIWDNKSDEEKILRNEKISKTWKNKTSEELDIKRKKFQETWKNKSEEELEEFIETMRSVRINKSDDELKAWNDNILESKRKNGSFNKSEPEEIMFKELVKIFGEDDIIRQYKEVRYPFACDFYIKSLDLFIELNASWTHGKHWFDKNNDKDVKKLELWKKKSDKSDFYKNAVTVWSEKDLEKKSYLEKLEHKVFWDNDLKDFCNWIENIDY